MPESVAPASRLSRHLAILNQRSRSADGISMCDQGALLAFTRDQLEIDSRVEDDDTALVTSDGASITLTAYQIDLSGGFARVAGVFSEIAALNNQVVIGTAAWTKSFALDGEAPVVLSADDKSYDAALVVIVDTASGLALDIALVVGAEADTGAEAEVTLQQIRDALEAGTTRETNPLTTKDLSCILVAQRLTFDRAGGAVTIAHGDPATDASLKAERLRGFSLAATAA